MNPLTIFNLFENESNLVFSFSDYNKSIKPDEPPQPNNTKESQTPDSNFLNITEKLSEDYFQEEGENSSSSQSINSKRESFNQIQINSTNKESDFIKISCCGHGSYGQVYKIKNKETNKIFALKEINKLKLKKENKYYQITIENEIMKLCQHSNIAKYYGCYENKNNFCIIEEFCPYGDLSFFLSENQLQLSTEEIQYIIAQIIICLEYLSKKNIIHRDIKPENFLITANFRLKLIDFATATFLGKFFDEKKNRFIDENFQRLTVHKESFANNENIDNDFNITLNEPSQSFCQTMIYRNNKLNITDSNHSSNILFDNMVKQKFVGTAEYMAPEIINSKKVGYYTDMWSVMCILFLCYTGHTPFSDKTEYLVFQNITHIKFNDKNINKIPDEAIDLLQKFFKIEPNKRLGFIDNIDFDFNIIKKHPFFILKNKNITLEEISQNLLNKCSKYKKNNFNNESDQIYENRTSNTSEMNNSKEENNKIEDNDGKILKSGLLKKRSPYYYYDLRKVVLYDTPKIKYIEPEKYIIKGEINLDKQCSAELIKSNQFQLVTPNRTYIFMCKERYDISPWVKAINDAIEKYGK